MKFHVIDGRRCEVKKAVTREQMDAMKYVLKPGDLTDGQMPAGNYGSLVPAAGFVPGSVGAGGSFVPPGGNVGGFWATGVDIDHDSYVPAAGPCTAVHANYGVAGTACHSCGHASAVPTGVPAFANRHPGPQVPGSRVVAPSPARPPMNTARPPMTIAGRGRKFTVHVVLRDRLTVFVVVVFQLWF